jgi:hypothetical protein
VNASTFDILACCDKKPIAKNLSMKACKKKTWKDKVRSVDAHYLSFLYSSILDDLVVTFCQKSEMYPFYDVNENNVPFGVIIGKIRTHR